jgi:hypothetical protein
MLCAAELLEAVHNKRQVQALGLEELCDFLTCDFRKKRIPQIDRLFSWDIVSEAM